MRGKWRKGEKEDIEWERGRYVIEGRMGVIVLVELVHFLRLIA